MAIQIYWNNKNQGSKRTISWNKYLRKVSTQAQNQYLDYLIDPNS